MAAKNVDDELIDIRAYRQAIVKAEKNLAELYAGRDKALLTARRDGWSMKALQDASGMKRARLNVVIVRENGGTTPTRARS